MLQSLSGLMIPVIVIGLAVVGLSLIAFLVRHWKRCAPNEVLVVYGRKRKVQVPKPGGAPGETIEVERGYRLIIGGATFVWPILEAVEKIDLSNFQVPFRVEDTPNIDGVLVSVDAMANMKVSSDPSILANAVERLLDKGGNQLSETATETLSGLLRQIVGTLTIEEIIKDREKISQQVLDAAVTELGKLGFELDNFVIQKITDNDGYIHALGKKRTAEVKRTATIAEAEAQRDADVKSAAAQREGATAKAKAEQEISDAERDRDMTKADNEAKVKRRQARIEVEEQTAAQEARKELERETVAANLVKVEEETKLQAAEKKRREAELDATVVTEAEKKAQALVIEAQGKQDAATREGEAARILQAKQGEGQRAYDQATAEGRKASAAAAQIEQEAAAAGEKAHLLAKAEGDKAQGEATGAAKLAILSAEAKGLDEKNKALANLSDGAKVIMILEQLPEIIKQAGESGEKVVASMFKEVGLGLGNIDSVQIVDMGGSGDGTSPVANFALNTPEIVAKTMAKFKGLGLNPAGIMSKLGIGSEEFNKLIPGLGVAAVAAKAGSDDGVLEAALKKHGMDMSHLDKLLPMLKQLADDADEEAEEAEVAADTKPKKKALSSKAAESEED